MQLLINEAQLDAASERYLFSSTKTKTMVARGTKPANLWINGKLLEITNEETHLGVTRTSSCNNLKTVESRINSARSAAYS